MNSNSAIRRGDRVRFSRDFKSPVGFSFKADQAGRVLLVDGETLVVECDGFDIEKKLARDFRRKHGEGPNVNCWIAEGVPIEAVDLIGEEDFCANSEQKEE
jgi:hypothetical protein